MELNKIGLIGGMLLASATTLSAAPTTVNDGKNMNNLTKIENKLNDANATIDLKVALRNGRWPIGHLEMVQSADITFPALRAAWYSEKLIPADNDYTLSAEFQPAAEEGMGGVISLLNNETGVGIVFQLNSFDAFQVGTVSFLADEEDANFNLDGLYNLDGSPAEEELGSAWSDLGEFDSSKFTIMKMTISPPTDEDKAALEDVTARITAVAHRTKTKQLEGTTEIVLLTNLALPEGDKHRFGYFGFWDSIWDDGSRIGNYRYLRFEGEQYNTPPTIEAIADVVSNEDEAVAEIALVGDDKETIKSKLQYTVVATNADLVAPDGLVLRKTGSRRYLDITPLENAFGETDITVTVNDGIDEVSTTFKLTINAVNDPPTISAVEPIKINEDQTVSFTVTLTDIDTAPEELKITGNAANAALLPSDNITSTGEGLTRTVTLSPGANMGGKTKVTLSVNDGDNTVSTETELTVIPVVDIPVALPQELTTKYGKHLPLTLTGTDPDSLGLSFHLVEMPKNGSLIGTAPNLTYRPKAGFEGMDTFQFRVVAGEHKSEPETIVITVLGLSKGDQPILSLARSNDGGLTISWVGEGVLQSSTDLKNWESIENAAKPHTVDPADARRFYRMVQP
ncbi:MAG: Ig-like domain-containing protein [Verrucomicrobiota bacterium]|nr:Ig-like domain-containing protein [Verrucomicrobiota bacterium]